MYDDVRRYSEFVEKCRELTKEVLEGESWGVAAWGKIRPIVGERVQHLDDPELLEMALLTDALDAQHDWEEGEPNTRLTARELIERSVASYICCDLIDAMEEGRDGRE